MIGWPRIRRHARMRELLSAYIDGEVSASETSLVEEHLAGCQECQDELASLRSTVGLLRRLPELAVPRSFALSEAPQRRPTPTIVWTARLATSVAAVLLVALLLGDIVGLVGQQRTLKDAVSRAEVQAAAAPAPTAAAALGPEAAARGIPGAPALELESAAELESAPGLAAAAPAPVPAAAAPAAPVPSESAQAFAAPAAPTTPTADAAPSPAAPAPAIAAAAAPSDGGIIPPQAPAEAPETATQELQTLTAEPDAAKALPTPAAPPVTRAAPPVTSVAPEEAAPPTGTSASSVDEGPEEGAEDDGLTLPLWQVETALGGLLVIFALATFWIARRSRWPL